ncbi:hypothetical protein ACOM2C_16155 [Pseudarthrobacter sp. So.54]
MIAILQWTTLAVCALAAIARIPSAIRGENRSIFGIFLLSAVAVLLSIDPMYVAIDTWLGSANYTNLILRFVIYATVLLAGYRIARAFNAANSIRFIAAPRDWRFWPPWAPPLSCSSCWPTPQGPPPG